MPRVQVSLSTVQDYKVGSSSVVQVWITMAATNSPSRSAFGGFVNDRTDLEAFEAEAAAQHAETAVPASPADATGPEEFECIHLAHSRPKDLRARLTR